MRALEKLNESQQIIKKIKSFISKIYILRLTDAIEIYFTLGAFYYIALLI